MPDMTPPDATIAAILAQYPLSDVRVTLHAQTHHRVYLVHCQQGEFMLRVQPLHTLPRIQTEVQHLVLMAGRAPIPHRILAADGAAWVVADDSVALLLEHLPGVNLTLAQLDAEMMRRLGVVLGEWHAASPTLDPVVTEAEALFGEGGMYPLSSLMAQLDPIQQQQVHQVYQALMPVLDRAGKYLLHGDFVLHNLLVSDQQVFMIDLEYSRAGDVHYDLAPLLWQVRIRSDWTVLQQSFLAGYQSSVQVLVDNLEPWIAARQLASIHWIAHNRALVPHTEITITRRLMELLDFLNTGHLARQP